MTLRSNPRLLIFFLILAALPLGALALYPRLPQFVGAAVLGLSLFIDFKIFCFAQPYIKTRIVTDESAITIYLAKEEEIFAWTEVALAGKCIFKNGRPFIFLYHLGKDKIITIPYEYTGMRNLEKTVSEKVPYEILELSSSMELRQLLHDRYHSDKV
jgi:hypothetical protein